MPRGRSKTGGSIAKAVPNDLPYGDRKKLEDAQSAVPMGTPTVPEAKPLPQAKAKVAPIPLTDPTRRPDESILTGSSVTRSTNPDMVELKKLLPLFEAESVAPNAPDQFRGFVKWLRDQ